MLVFLVESGALYFCIWVHFNRLLYLTSIVILPPAADVCHGCGIELVRGAFLPYNHRSTRRKILSLRVLSDEVNSCHQGIYPTTIFVVVTLRMSAADILSHPGLDTRLRPSTLVFAPPPPTVQHSILVTATASSSDKDSFVGSREDKSSSTPASSDPEKGGKIVHGGYVS